MGIKKRAETGQHFISAPAVRSSRQRYEKSPLAPAGRGLIATIIDFFRRDGRYFIGSPIAQRIDRGLRVARRVIREDAPVSSTSGLVISISDQLRQHFIEAYTRADNAHHALTDDMRQEEAWLDEARPAEILSTLETKVEDERVHLHTELLPLADELVSSRVSLDRFRRKHRLTDDELWGKRLDMAVFGQVGVLLLVEFIANTLFQSDTQKTGILGGLLVATLTSLATIILGMFFGIGVQRSRIEVSNGRWSGFLLIVLSSVLSFIFVSSLSLIRMAGENGDPNPIETARLQLMADPFAGIRAMLDLPAFAYTLCISALIITVAYKYLQYFGWYPGLRKWALHYADALEEFEGAYQDNLDYVKDIAREHTEMLEAAPEFIVHCKVPIRTLVADHENVVEQHVHDGADILGAGQLFTAFLRDHGGDGASEVRLPLPEHNTIAQENVEKLARWQAEFKKWADDLCDRDDVSADTVAKARDELNDLIERKLEEFADEREKIRNRAIERYKQDHAWGKDVAKMTGGDEPAFHDDLNIEGLV